MLFLWRGRRCGSGPSGRGTAWENLNRGPAFGVVCLQWSMSVFNATLYQTNSDLSSLHWVLSFHQSLSFLTWCLDLESLFNYIVSAVLFKKSKRAQLGASIIYVRSNLRLFWPPLPLVRISLNLSVLFVRKIGPFLNPPLGLSPSVRTYLMEDPLCVSKMRALS